jgi:hypothetical protein
LPGACRHFAGDGGHDERDAAVVDEDAVARVPVARHVVGGDDAPVAGGEVTGPAATCPRRILGPCSVDEHTHAATGVLACATHLRVRRFLVARLPSV